MVNGSEFRQTTSGVHGNAGCADGLPRGRSFCSLPKAKIFFRSNGCSLSGFSPASVSEGFQRVSGKSFGAPAGAYPCWGLTRRLRRGSKACRPMGRSFSSGGPKGAVNGKPTARLRAHNHAEGLTRRLRRGRWGCRPEGGSTFFRSERKYQRKHAARRLQRRPAPLRVIRKYRRSGHCRARLLYLLRPASR